jgi:NAD(P)-dependent dehydrogenase (short-subunit alcohol dehydrogenase family)
MSAAISASPLAVVTGAGSGVGRAVVLKLVAEGWRVALVGRREDALRETAALAGLAAGDRLGIFPCDVSVAAAVDDLAAAVASQLGPVDAVIAAAGVNTPRRSWAELSVEKYHELLGGNLHGAFHGVRSFLPAMRRRRQGTFVFINSEAGLKASPKAGVGYVAAKFGLAGLAQSLNAEERPNGIRACSIFPGDIDTPILNHRPQPPSAEARAKMMRPEDIAACVWLVVSLPARAVVEELVVRPA